MQAYYWRRLTLVEVTAHRLPYIHFQVIHGICLGENGMPERAGFVASLGRLLDGEDNLSFWHMSGRDYTPYLSATDGNGTHVTRN